MSNKVQPWKRYWQKETVAREPSDEASRGAPSSVHVTNGPAMKEGEASNGSRVRLLLENDPHCVEDSHGAVRLMLEKDPHCHQSAVS